MNDTTQFLDDELTSLCQEFDEAVNDLKHCAEDDARKDAALKLAQAQAYLRAEGTIPQREAQAVIAVQKEYLEAKIADAMREAARARVKKVDKQLSILQTRSANLRDEMGFSRYPEPVGNYGGRMVARR